MDVQTSEFSFQKLRDIVEHLKKLQVTVAGIFAG